MKMMDLHTDVKVVSSTLVCVCVRERERGKERKKRMHRGGDQAGLHCKPDYYAVILRLYTHMDNEAINC